MIKKIISGGQTGADQAGLEAAIELGIAHGGWIPKGRKTEDGPLPAKYKLKEMGTTSYPKRTEQNILDSEGTVIYNVGKQQGQVYTLDSFRLFSTFIIFFFSFLSRFIFLRIRRLA